MTSREAFEAQDRARYDIDATLYSSDHMGRYRDRPIQCRWETWQAAIQHAREVAVKACEEIHDDYFRQARKGDNTGKSDARADAADDCADAIKEALK